MGSGPDSLAVEGPRRRPAAWRWGLLALLFLLPLGLFHAPHGIWQTCELAIDMQVGDEAAGESGVIDVWVNSTAGEPLHQQIVPGAHQTYRFQLENYQSIDFFRIDPTETPRQRVRLYGVRIRKGEETIHSFSARSRRMG